MANVTAPCIPCFIYIYPGKKNPVVLPQTLVYSVLQMSLQIIISGSRTVLKKREHITPVLINLHWLLVRYRIHYKVLLYTFKALHGFVPENVFDLISLHQSNRSLCSNDQLHLVFPCLKCKSDQDYSVAAPRLLHSVFQSALKSF